MNQNRGKRVVLGPLHRKNTGLDTISVPFYYYSAGSTTLETAGRP